MVQGAWGLLHLSLSLEESEGWVSYSHFLHRPGHTSWLSVSLSLEATTAYKSRNGPQDSKGGVTHVPQAPLEGAYSHSFSRRKLRTHTVYQEDADHLHSLLYSPNYRPDLCHVNPRMSSLWSSLSVAGMAWWHAHSQISNIPLASICPGSFMCCAPHHFLNFLNCLWQFI